MFIDISQELFSCAVFPGDEQPQRRTPQLIKNGDVCNLTELSMCAHNGTHIDAPYHFIDDGLTVDQLPLETLIGDCYVSFHSGDVTAADAEAILEKARAAGAGERILIGGDATVTAEAAKVFADAAIKLIGNESQTVGPVDSPKQVHLTLLGKGIVLLEGIRLGHVKEGRYRLIAAPLNLGGSDGSPCRAVLETPEV